MFANVNRIIPFSNVDGPGNRLAVFFQKCNFACRYCHNPETINDCIGCGLCVEKCPVKALSFNEDHKVVWDAEKCVACDTCIKTCPNMASPKISHMSVEDILERIEEVRPYIKGITTSGGECTLHKDFLIPLFKEVKKMGLTCFVDSNGTLDFEKEKEFTDVLDMVMLDVKAYDNEWHRILCSSDNEMVLKNLHYLLKIGKLYEVRTVLLPGRDRENENTVRNVASVIGDRCIYKIIRYRPFGVRESEVKDLGEFEMPLEEAERFVALAKELGASKAYVV